jgi:hypothetical protein
MPSHLDPVALRPRLSMGLPFLAFPIVKVLHIYSYANVFQ